MEARKDFLILLSAKKQIISVKQIAISAETISTINFLYNNSK
jgi:hypothetical protein